jgi:hypothetical protein
MGIDWVDQPNEKPSKPIHLKEVSAKDVVSYILSQQEGQNWEIVDGVVEVNPVRFYDDPRNFLNIRFPEYAVRRDSLFEASYWLRVRIKRLLHPERNFGGGFGGTSIDKDFNAPTISFSARDVTVRQVLDKLILAHGNSLWVVHLHSTVLMEGEPFYAQAASPTTGRGSPDFTWSFVTLGVNTRAN